MIDAAIKQFQYYKLLGDRTFEQLSDDQLFWKPDERANSIAVIVNHLHGNMMSRWTDFLRSDGEKTWRNRDQEFEDAITTREMLSEKWEQGWSCLFEALTEVVGPDQLEDIIYIRNQGHSVQEAIIRQMMHYSYHVGQITYIGRMLRGSDWQSLSIPKGASKSYNTAKFSEEKKRAHFTDEYIKK